MFLTFINLTNRTSNGNTISVRNPVTRVCVFLGFVAFFAKTEPQKGKHNFSSIVNEKNRLRIGILFS